VIRTIHLLLVISWVLFIVFEFVGFFERGNTIGLIGGTFFAAMGLTSLLDPRLQGVRDMGLIQTESVDFGERVGGQLLAVLLIIFGLLASWLFWP
jgi:hypothetical protein